MLRREKSKMHPINIILYNKIYHLSGWPDRYIGQNENADHYIIPATCTMSAEALLFGKFWTAASKQLQVRCQNDENLQHRCKKIYTIWWECPMLSQNLNSCLKICSIEHRRTSNYWIALGQKTSVYRGTRSQGQSASRQNENLKEPSSFWW